MIGGNPVGTFRAGIRVGRAVTIAFILVRCARRVRRLAARLAHGRRHRQSRHRHAVPGLRRGRHRRREPEGRLRPLSGVFAGVLLLSSIQTAINVMGMPPHYTQMIQGGLVLAAVLLDTLKTTVRRRYL